MSTSETLRATTQIPQPVRQSTRLPTAFPDLPADIFTGDATKRKATAERWNNEVRSWWKTARMAMQQDYEELSAGSNTSINKSNALDSALRTEITARNDGDASLLQQVQTLVLNSGAGPNRIFLQTGAPTSPTTGDLWYKIEFVDGVPKIRPWYYDGVAWQDVRDSAVADTVVALSSEQTARLAGDSALGQRIDAIRAVIDDDETGLTAQATALGSLTTQVGTINGTLGSQNTRIASLESTVGDESGGLVAQVNTIASTFVTETTASSLAASAISAQLDVGGTIRGAISALDDKVFVGAESLASKVATLEATGVGDLSDLVARVDEIEDAYITENEANTKKQEAITAAGIYTDTTTKKNRTFRQSTTPGAASGRVDGDLWIHTGENNKLYRFNAVSNSWVASDDIRIATAMTNIATINNTLSTKVDATGAAAEARTEIASSINSTTAGSIGARIKIEADTRATRDTELTNAAVGQYVLQVDSGGKVAGMKLTATSVGGGAGTSQISFLADSFKIYNNRDADVVPFEVVDNVVRIKAAMIGSLSAGIITSGTLTSCSIGAVRITGATIDGGEITSGSAKMKNGEITGVKLSGVSFSSGTISSSFGQIDRVAAGPLVRTSPIPANTHPAAGTDYPVTTGMRLIVNGDEWVTGNLVVARDSTEQGSVYARNLYLGPTPNYTYNATSGARATVVSTTDANGEYVVLEVADRNNVKTTVSGGTVTVSTLLSVGLSLPLANPVVALSVGSSNSADQPAYPNGVSVLNDGRIRGETFWGRRCIGNINAGNYLVAANAIDLRSSAITETNPFVLDGYIGRLRYASNRIEMLSRGASGMYFANEVSGDFSFATSSTKRLQFGEYVPGLMTATGTITIKDSSGVERKLLVVA